MWTLADTFFVLLDKRSREYEVRVFTQRYDTRGIGTDPGLMLHHGIRV